MGKVTGRAAKGAGGPRLSITVPSDEHTALQRIATDKRVSLAWVVRDAVTKYLSDRNGSADRKSHQRQAR